MPSVLFYSLVSMLVLLSILLPRQEADPDLWGKISIGAILFETGRFPLQDFFSFTATGQPWIDHEWLTGVFYYTILSTWGEQGLMIFKYGALFTMLLLICVLHRYCYRRAPVLLPYALFLFFEFYYFSCMMTLRAQFFSFLGVLTLIFLIEAIRFGRIAKRNILWTVPLLLLWGNLHAGFVVGLGILFLYGLISYIQGRRTSLDDPAGVVAIRDGQKLMLLPCVLFLLIGLLNPYGFQYLVVILMGLTLDRFLVMEWNPIPLFSMEHWPTKLLFLIFLVSVLTKYFLESRPNTSKALLPEDTDAGMKFQNILQNITPVLIVLVTFAMSVRAVRFQSFFILTLLAYTPLFIPSGLFSVFHQLPKSVFSGLKIVVFYVIPLLIGAHALTLLVQMPETFFWKSIVPDENQNMYRYQGKYPVGAVNFLKKSGYSGNIVNLFAAGEFIMWNLYPRFKISMDGRYEAVYSQEQMLDNFLFYYSDPAHLTQSREDYLKSIHADFIIVARMDPAVEQILSLKDWTLIYRDPFYAVLSKEPLRAGQKPVIIDPPTPAEWSKPYSPKEYYIDDFLGPEYLQAMKQYPVSKN